MPSAYSGMGFWECHGFGFWVAGDSMMRVRYCHHGPHPLSVPTALDSTHTVRLFPLQPVRRREKGVRPRKTRRTKALVICTPNAMCPLAP